MGCLTDDNGRHMSASLALHNTQAFALPTGASYLCYTPLASSLSSIAGCLTTVFWLLYGLQPTPLL
jgi:hypothetical protein